MKFVILILMMPMMSFAATAEKVKQKASETVDATAEYANATKEDFKKGMEKDLADLKTEIDTLKVKIAKTSDEVSAKTKKEMDTRLATLEKKRADLNKNLDAAATKSGRAWDRLKVGLQSAMADLKDGYNEAKKEIQAKSEDESK